MCGIEFFHADEQNFFFLNKKYIVYREIYLFRASFYQKFDLDIDFESFTSKNYDKITHG